MHACIPNVSDFSLDSLDNPAWEKAALLPLSRTATGDLPYATEARVLYSSTGLYFRYECEDRRLSCTFREDFEDLFKEDVIEIFLWPDESDDSYIEYELSPLDYELPLLVTNHEGSFHGWLPWKYHGERRCRHATAVRGGEKKPGSMVTGWKAGVFIPFEIGRAHV